ncbi:Hypothetical Protein FCC1311_067482 [Hondaea fermentalgiana]|uniref:Uncharacterized protein n=1 Tax=Hondaea fermentalgiana TaxID=2315210 RepID=A0A2R5GLB2_9STRA|nr:Hypothetical Protein FCC1311_067482 [Hondaea fermentalgiana]|eukprot:GBG30528.1 Hypothetical Protein FCC1311_067482 [Hondaea fermentalgiana]
MEADLENGHEDAPRRQQQDLRLRNRSEDEDEGKEEQPRTSTAAHAAQRDADDGDDDSLAREGGRGGDEWDAEGREEANEFIDAEAPAEAKTEAREQEKAKRSKRRPRFVPPRIYNPPSLMECCLSTIGERPDVAVLHQDLYGFGQDMLARMLLAIIQRGNLTIPLVRRFETVAREEGHDLIEQFVEGLDIFAAI